MTRSTLEEKTGNELDQLLTRRIATCQQEALRTGGEISPDQIESLARLARLAEICRSIHPTAPPKRWVMAAVFGVSLTIVSYLLFAHVSETEIELNVRASEVGFSLAGRQVLCDGIVLTALGVSGLHEIQIPRSRTHDSQSWVSSDGPDLSVRLLAASLKQGGGTITLGPLQLPGNTRVGVRRMRPTGQYRLSVNGNELGLSIDVNGLVKVERSDGPRMDFDFVSPGSVLLHPASSGVDFDLVFSDPFQADFSAQLPVRDLSFMHIEEFLSSNNPTVRRVSSVLSGTLYLESLNGEEHKLRSAEALQFDRSDGQIRVFELGPDNIVLAFQGRVRGMTTGSGEDRRNLMPTRLEWLRARHGLSLLWGSAVYLFGLAAGAIRWWRTPK
jgi:hypothetical protein